MLPAIPRMHRGTVNSYRREIAAALQAEGAVVILADNFEGVAGFLGAGHGPIEAVRLVATTREVAKQALMRCRAPADMIGEVVDEKGSKRIVCLLLGTAGVYAPLPGWV